MDELSIVGLNCGSGPFWKAGFLHVDSVPLLDSRGEPTVTNGLARVGGEFLYLVHDLTAPLPATEETFELIYSEHFIEHVSWEDGIAWLSEMRRVLRPGGTLRVTTPDLQSYVSGYSDPDRRFYDQHRQRLAAVGMAGVPERRAWMINQAFMFWGHRWIYDFDELTAAAVAAGFDADSVRRMRYGASSRPELAGLDRSVRNDETLYVEITTPR